MVIFAPMKKALYILLLALPLCAMHRAPAQTRSDTDAVFRLVFEDFVGLGLTEVTDRIGVVDSSCDAVFYGGFPDTINKKYFGYDADNYIQGEVFRRDFVAKSKVNVLIPATVYEGLRYQRVARAEMRKCFSSQRTRQLVITEKGFEKFAKLYGLRSYCEVSNPYFITANSVLIYFNYQNEFDNNFQNVYVVERQPGGWKIIARLMGWL